MGFFCTLFVSCSAIKFSGADGTLVVTLQLSRACDWEEQERVLPSLELSQIGMTTARSSVRGHSTRFVHSKSIPPSSDHHAERNAINSKGELLRASNTALGSRCALWMTVYHACKARLLKLCGSRRTTENAMYKATGPIEVRVEHPSGNYYVSVPKAGAHRCGCPQ